MKNIEGTNHNSEVEVRGLKDGAYKIVVNGTKVSSFTAVSGQTMKVIVPMTDEANTESIISIEPEYFVTKTAPEINAGEDKNTCSIW